MTDEMREQVRQSIRHFRLPAYDEITDVGLYLDQTCRYINEYLFPLGEEAAITSSMISNYVKHHLVSSPVHKQYSRNQIAMLIFISMTKSILSMEQIGKLKDVGLQLFEKRDAYEYFRTTLNEGLLYVFGHTSEPPVLHDPDPCGEKMIVLSTIIAIAHKIYLNMCFAAIDSSTQDPAIFEQSRSRHRKKG